MLLLFFWALTLEHFHYYLMSNIFELFRYTCVIRKNLTAIKSQHFCINRQVAFPLIQAPLPWHVFLNLNLQSLYYQ